MIASASARDMLDTTDSALHEEAMAKAREAAEVAAELEAQALEGTRPHKRMSVQQRALMKRSDYYRPRNKFVSLLHVIDLNEPCLFFL